MTIHNLLINRLMAHNSLIHLQTAKTVDYGLHSIKASQLSGIKLNSEGMPEEYLSKTSNINSFSFNL